jgi:hypothetical protein
LSELPDPHASLREYLSLIEGPTAQRIPAIAAILASKFTDGELLRALPADEALTNRSQAENAATLIAAALGEDRDQWAAWSRLTEGLTDSGITLGQLLSDCRP